MGSIESVMRQCVVNWSSPTIYKHTKRMGLSPRLTLVGDLVQEQKFSAESKTVFLRALKEATTLIQTRNTVAHHPLSLMLFHERDWPFEEGIFPNDSEEGSITLEGLETAVQKAEKVASDLHEALALFRTKSIDEYLAEATRTGLPASNGTTR
ncbi:hypothetical protein D3C87_1672420 [compost metagenome]